jgi:methyl-accepting chemotaxis protein
LREALIVNLSLGKKVGFGYAIILGLVICSTAWTYFKISGMRNTGSSLITRRIPEIIYSKDLVGQTNLTMSKGREYILADGPEGAQNAKRDWEKSWAAIDTDVSKLQELISQSSDETQRKSFSEIHDRITAFRKMQETALQLRAENGPDSLTASGTYFANQVSPFNKQTKASLEQLVQKIVQRTQEDSSALNAGGVSTSFILLISTLLVTAVGTGLSIFLTRHILGPLGKVVERANSIADGNLAGAKLATNAHDEIQDLMQAMNRMQENLSRLISNISQNATNLATAADEISSAATQSSTGAEAQDQEMTQVATAMQEMAASVREVSEHSHRAADGARSAAQTAKHGGNVVEQALTSMRSISSSSTTSAERIAELSNSSGRIGKIVAVIDEVADQTNLLALNAAIEAARAGEQGRGFAVVADEVRKLAERTTKATHEIAGMIEEVQTQAKNAVAAMDTGKSQVELGVETTSQAGVSLAEIISAADQVGDMVTQIATAATEQSSTSEEINRSMERISTITHTSVAGAQQSVKTCQELSNLALNLQQLVGQFQLDDTVAERRQNPGQPVHTALPAFTERHLPQPNNGGHAYR